VMLASSASSMILKLVASSVSSPKFMVPSADAADFEVGATEMYVVHCVSLVNGRKRVDAALDHRIRSALSVNDKNAQAVPS